MVDFHTHILPGIDDGSISTEMSVKMIDSEIRQGIDTIILTPHFYANHNTPEKFLNERAAAFSELKTALTGTPLNIKLLLGCEVHYFPNIGKVESMRELCVEGTDVLLLEPPFRALDGGFYRDVEELSYGMNLTVVIAHIERYINVFNAVKTIERLKDCGAYIQSNAEFFAEGSGRFALKLLKKGLIDVLGTDCHNLGNRAPNMELASEKIIKSFGTAEFDDFTDTAYSILGID